MGRVPVSDPHPPAAAGRTVRDLDRPAQAGRDSPTSPGSHEPMSGSSDLSALRIDRTPPPPRRGGAIALRAALVFVALVAVSFLALRLSRGKAAIEVTVGTAEATGGG